MCKRDFYALIFGGLEEVAIGVKGYFYSLIFGGLEEAAIGVKGYFYALILVVLRRQPQV